MTTPAIVVVGGASTDFVAYGRRLPASGEEQSGEEFRRLPGGKGVNQALAVARLGWPVGLIARVGTDAPGDELLEHLVREGVDVSRCVRDPDAETGAILLMVDHAGTKQSMTVPGATSRLSPADIARSEDLIERAHLLLVQFEIPGATLQSAIAAARRGRKRVILDAGHAMSFPEEQWREIYVLRANANEAATLSGIEVTDAATAARACRHFRDRGVEVAAIEAGREGNVLMWPDGECLFPLIPVATVDRTGSGDALTAALAVAVLEEQPWNEAGWFANAAAALTTTRLGAGPGLPRRPDVLSLLSHIGQRSRAHPAEQSHTRKDQSTMTMANQPQPEPETGISHHPLEEEQHRQDQVPPHPQPDGAPGAALPGVSGRGHRPAREESATTQDSSEHSVARKGSKGGKTGGSRAGLRSSSKADKQSL